MKRESERLALVGLDIRSVGNSDLSSRALCQSFNRRVYIGKGRVTARVTFQFPIRVLQRRKGEVQSGKV